ncbi:GNAT family N-acetyltransferase [Clostridium perfringens]|nr:GNAT family N-acetyltransferase [Clostridium perfringens]
MENKGERKKSFMVKNKLEKIYSTSLPNGYRFTEFRPGDENNWTYIQYSAGVFKEYQLGVRAIFKESNKFKRDFRKRCVFLENENGERIGTVMVLPSATGEEGVQEIKYLSIIPKYQGQGLGKLLISKAYKIVNEIEGATRINLETDNDKSIGFFENLGFEKLS